MAEANTQKRYKLSSSSPGFAPLGFPPDLDCKQSEKSEKAKQAKNVQKSQLRRKK